MHSTDATALQNRLVTLEERCAALEAREARRTARVRRALTTAGVVLAVGATGAWAADGLCPNGLPFCFVADTPVLASEVNQNFAQLKEWSEQKVGTSGTANVTMTGTLDVTGAVTLAGALSSPTVATSSLVASAIDAGTVRVGALQASTIDAGTVSVSGNLVVSNNTWGTGPVRQVGFNRSGCARCLTSIL